MILEITLYSPRISLYILIQTLHLDSTCFVFSCFQHYTECLQLPYNTFALIPTRILRDGDYKCIVASVQFSWNCYNIVNSYLLNGNTKTSNLQALSCSIFLDTVTVSCLIQVKQYCFIKSLQQHTGCLPSYRQPISTDASYVQLFQILNFMCVKTGLYVCKRSEPCARALFDQYLTYAYYRPLTDTYTNTQKCLCAKKLMNSSKILEHEG